MIVLPAPVGATAMMRRVPAAIMRSISAMTSRWYGRRSVIAPAPRRSHRRHRPSASRDASSDICGHALPNPSAALELVEKGFIEPRTRGAYSVKFRRATEWRLNDRRCDVTGKAQSQAFLKWSGDVQGSAEPQATSASRAKPWRVLNMSRAKWYRLDKPVPEAMRETVRQSA
jgi:hypothetical protein